MNIFKEKLKLHELLFLLAGAGMIISIFWIEKTGFSLWFIIKSFYFAGILFFMREVFKNTKEKSLNE